MLLYLFWAITLFFAVFQVFKPIWGLCFLSLQFLIKPFQFFPAVTDYHTNLILSGILFISCFIRKIDFRKKSFFILVTVFISATLLSSAIAGVGKEFGTTYISEYFKCFLITSIIVSYINSRYELVLLLKTFVWGALCNAIYAVPQQLFHIRSGREDLKYLDINRACGFQGDPNELASMLVAFIPIAYYFYLHGESKLLRRFYIVAILAYVIGIFFSISRAGFIALLFVGSCIIIKNIKSISIILVVGLCILIFSYFAKNLFEQRRSTIETSLSGKAKIEHSAYSRIRYAQYAIQLWFYHPVFGVGPGRFAEAVRSELGDRSQKHVVHNSFLQILVEQGILGFIPFIGIVILAFKDIVKLRGNDNVFYSELSWYMGISLTGFLICCLFFSMQRFYLTWIYLIFPIVLEKISRNELEQKKDTVLVL